MQSVHRRTRFVLPWVISGIVLSTSGAASAATPTSQHPPTVSSAEPDLPPILPNDNRRRAGKLENGVLTVRLEARSGVWYPEGKKGIGLPVSAFGEEGKLAQTPGPLIRVRVGTEVRAIVRNSLAKPLTLFGFGAERGVGGDSVIVEPGVVREIRFIASTPGTFYYIGKTSKSRALGRLGDDSQLNGVIVVDSVGAPDVPDDRIFAIGWWASISPKSPSGLERGTLVINGRSWPHTERLDVTQGDSLRWRWVNLTEIAHPMHLHGFYFRVDAVGNGSKHTHYAPDERRQAVTELMAPGGTMSLVWSPNRSGNWVFHCHFVGHISHLVSLGTVNGVRTEAATHEHGGRGAHETHQMAGLVLGIRVAPRGVAVATPDKEYRPMRLLVRSKPNVYGPLPGYAYVLGGTPAEQDTALTLPGPTLVLQKDEPVAITVVNQSHVPAAVHWHGIELESFPDGVPGWSGSGTSVLPAIPPNDSLTVRFTPPRAGTFMYHSHFDEFGQIGSGLYGSIVVLDKGDTYDGITDRVLLISDDGPTTNMIAGPFPKALLNGSAQPAPIQMLAGVTYRLRLINIRTDYPASISILEGGKPLEWRLIAKDGADLPASQATMRPSTLTFAAGEIYDVVFTPRTWGNLTLQFGAPNLGPLQEQATRVPIHVR